MATANTFMQGIESLRNIEWSRTWCWDVKFGPGADLIKNPGPPAPFDSWFPASDYQETTNIAHPLTHQFYLSSYKFMYQTDSTDIQMTVHDDVYGTIYNWMTDWFKSALDNTDGVAMIQNAWRTLNVMKLDPSQNVLTYYVYYVIPEGSITEALNSHADTKMYNLSFSVIGRETPIDSSQGISTESTNNSFDDDNTQAPVFNNTVR